MTTSIMFDRSSLVKREVSVPAGDYIVSVVSVVPTAIDAERSSMRITLKITDGMQEGRYLFPSPWLSHSVPGAVSYGNEQIEAFFSAVDAPEGNFDLSELVGAELMVTAEDPNKFSNGYNVVQKFASL